MFQRLLATVTKLTFPGWLHARSNVHGVTEETVFRRRVSYHSCTDSKRSRYKNITARTAVRQNF